MRKRALATSLLHRWGLNRDALASYVSTISPIYLSVEMRPGKYFDITFIHNRLFDNGVCKGKIKTPEELEQIPKQE